MARGKTRKSVVDSKVNAVELILGRKVTPEEFSKVAESANADFAGEWEPVGGMAYRVKSCTCCATGVKVSHGQFDHTGMIVLGGHMKSGGYDRYNLTAVIYSPDSFTQSDGVEKMVILDQVPYTIFRKHHELEEIGPFTISVKNPKSPKSPKK